VYNGTLWVNETVSETGLFGNIDGGDADSEYGGTTPIVGGSAVLS
jgi:hypothetical protein